MEGKAHMSAAPAPAEGAPDRASEAGAVDEQADEQANTSSEQQNFPLDGELDGGEEEDDDEDEAEGEDAGCRLNTFGYLGSVRSHQLRPCCPSR